MLSVLCRLPDDEQPQHPDAAAADAARKMSATASSSCYVIRALHFLLDDLCVWTESSVLSSSAKYSADKKSDIAKEEGKPKFRVHSLSYICFQRFSSLKWLIMTSLTDVM